MTPPPNTHLHMQSAMTGHPRVLYFPAIDILRGFAAYSVILLHVIAHTSWADFPHTGPLSWFRAGGLGVDLFFVISGFVVYYSALSLYDQQSYKRFLIGFSLRRLFRIYPLYLATLLFSLFLVHSYLLDHPALWSHVVAHLFFVHSFDFDWFSSINGVNWSIAIEVQFYALIALVLPLLVRVGIFLPVTLFVLIAWAWKWWAWSMIPEPTDPIGVYRLFVLSTQLPGRLDQFGIGMTIAVLLRSAPRFTATLARPGVRWVGILLSAVLFYTLVFPRINFFPSGQSAFVFGGTLYAVAFGAIVLTACLWDSPRFLAWSAPARYAGRISYGLYLWHLPLLMLLKESGFNPGLIAALTLSLATLVAALSWHFFEEPLLHLGRRIERIAMEKCGEN